MKPIQIGTTLPKNDATSEIYKRFHDYFDIKDKGEYDEKYVISSEPSEELKQAITIYYTDVKEKNKAHDEFIDHVAKEVIEELSKEYKDYIFLHPESSEHHYGLGLAIRNKYIYGHELNFTYFHPDALSAEITARIASFIIDNYDFENPFYRYLYDNFIFCHFRRLYFAMQGELPDSLMEHYAGLPDKDGAAKEFESKIRTILLNDRRFKQLCNKYGVTKLQYEECKNIIDTFIMKNWQIVPYDIVILTSKRLEADLREQMLTLLETVLKETPQMALELPAYVFNQVDAVILAVSAIGKSLKRFPRFNNRDDVIRAALINDGEAIQYVNKELRDSPEYLHLALSNEYSQALKMRCMKKYRDDEAVIRIALEANGRNIEYVSDRLKDDLNTAKFAVTHQKDWYPNSTVCHLSSRLRDNIEIALLDIREGHACVNSYSDRLRDCDEVAEALISTDQRWKLYMMSERIQNQYKSKE